MTREEIWLQIISDIKEQIHKLDVQAVATPRYSDVLKIYQKRKLLVRRVLSAKEASLTDLDPVIWKLSIND